MSVVRSLVSLGELRAMTSIAHRTLSSFSPSSTTAHSPKADNLEEINACYNRLDLSFKNTKKAFKGKTTREIVRALVVLPMCTLQMFVKNSEAFLTFYRRIFSERLFKKVLKLTFFGQFVGGETLEEAKQTILRLQKCGVKSILDYSVEADISELEAQKKAVEGIVGGDLKTEAVGSVVDKQTIEKTRNRFAVHKEFADRRKDVVSARTYFYESEALCDRSCDIFCQSADVVAETGGEGFLTVKLTALGRPQILLRLSEIIAQSQNFYKALTGSTWENMVFSKIKKERFMEKLKEFGVQIDNDKMNEWLKSVDFDDCGFVDYYDWGKLIEEHRELDQMFQVYNKKTKKLEPMLNCLTPAESQQTENMLDRMVKIIEHACQKNVRTMIDAEQTYFQPAISRLTLAMMRKYNKERGMVFNTYQAYLKSCLRDVELDMHIAKRENFHFGCKVVRGAYMIQERKRAAALGYEDPIQPDIEATAEMYRQVLRRIVEERMERGRGWVSVMVATHNEETVQLAVETMKKNNIAPSERTICFAQLYGMCDQVSYSLGQAGYSVYKYVPYGPLDEVLPYLSRRAQENGAVFAKVRKECGLLARELLRRTGTLNGRLSA